MVQRRRHTEKSNWQYLREKLYEKYMAQFFIVKLVNGGNRLIMNYKFSSKGLMDVKKWGRTCAWHKQISLVRLLVRIEKGF